MKSTSQRLAESYCRPQTEEEWKKVAGIRPLGKRFCHQKDAKSYWIENLIGVVSDDTVPHDRTEIPVSHFINLLHDRIAPWRLEEDGFATAAHGAGDYKFNTLMGDVIISWDSLGDAMLITMDTDEPLENIATYTDLITLMRLIG